MTSLMVALLFTINHAPMVSSKTTPLASIADITISCASSRNSPLKDFCVYFLNNLFALRVNFSPIKKLFIVPAPSTLSFK